MPTRTRTRRPRAKPATAAGRKGAATRGKRRPPAKSAKGTTKRRVQPAKRKAQPKRRPQPERKTRRPALRERLRTAATGRLGGLRRKLLLATVAAGLLALGYFGWLRDSPLVGIRDVEVVGVTGEQKQRIEKALTKAAKKMTTLHVDEGALAAATASFPAVKSLDADAGFPSGLRVEVEQRRPALIARSRAETLAVADDGALLPGVEVPKGEKLPAIDVTRLPGGGRLEGSDLEQALVVGAVPEPLAALVESVAYEADEGVVVTLEGGLPVHFGTGGRAEAKWAAAAAVLADPRLKQVSYVDVRVPERAAAGGAAPDAPSTPALPAPDPQTLE